MVPSFMLRPHCSFPDLAISSLCLCRPSVRPLSAALRPQRALLRRLPQEYAALTPFPATHTSHLQPAENKITLTPAVVNLDAASSLTPLFATLTKNTRGGGMPNLRSSACTARLQLAGRTGFNVEESCGLIHVVVHGEDLIEAVLVRINVDHPAEDNRVKPSAGCGAGVFRGDGAVQPELRPVGGAKFLARRHAEICMQVPHGDAQRHAGIELVFGGALGHGVHRADKLIARGGFLVEQGSRARGIEG